MLLFTIVVRSSGWICSRSFDEIRVLSCMGVFALSFNFSTGAREDGVPVGSGPDSLAGSSEVCGKRRKIRGSGQHLIARRGFAVRRKRCFGVSPVTLSGRPRFRACTIGEEMCTVEGGGAPEWAWFCRLGFPFYHGGRGVRGGGGPRLEGKPDRSGGLRSYRMRARGVAAVGWPAGPTLRSNMINGARLLQRAKRALSPSAKAE
ncbi:hypothetical protein SCOR_08810 [Sulfidibacter corallicola]